MATFVIGVVLGGYVTLTVRSIFASFAANRMARAAEASLEPDQLARLKAYIATAEAHEAERVLTRVK